MICFRMVPVARLASRVGAPVFPLLLVTGVAMAAESRFDELLNQAQAAFGNGQRAEAIALVTKAIEIDPKNFGGYDLRGRFYEAQKEHAKAVEDFTQALKLSPDAAQVFQRRGSEHLKAGHFDQAIRDFDRYLELVPNQKPYHWQRGIALYYAGRYDEARRQFELHQTVNRDDVENAVWHYLCVARLAGVEKARASLIKIQNDRRVPMMAVYALFGGKSTPEDVMAVAKLGAAFPEQLKRQLFYGNFYIGLFYEAAGRGDLARDYISRAVPQAMPADYMGDVAQMHAEILNKRAVKQIGADDKK